jgi:hypothetical protein
VAYFMNSYKASVVRKGGTTGKRLAHGSWDLILRSLIMHPTCGKRRTQIHAAEAPAITFAYFLLRRDHPQPVIHAA